MEIYLVGGAVRDTLLGLSPKERDWVVIGAKPQDMEKQGFKKVGNDFPVFLHPDTHEEYALARTERKTRPGYIGFDVNASPEVTLEQDLKRRDLTINAIAQDQQGNIIDPFNGQADIKNRLLRHVSPAFNEDPVRVLRVARFAARFAEQGFTVAPDTNLLMREMVKSGEVDALVAERIWKELHKALTTDHPQKFFEALRECSALKKLFPEIEKLFGVPQPEIHHPEIDTGVHTMMVLEQAARLSSDPLVRFAALLHDLGKASTPKDEWPKHVGHEQRSIPLVKAVCERLRVPNEYQRLAIEVARYHLHYHRAAELKPATMLKVIQAINSFQNPQRLEHFLLACEADSRGRLGFENNDYPQADIIRSAYKAAALVSSKPLVDKGLKGTAIGQELQKLRIEAIKNCRKD
jgi:tRNA nucleotidyltransferase (CCA-adding enzyme)